MCSDYVKFAVDGFFRVMGIVFTVLLIWGGLEVLFFVTVYLLRSYRERYSRAGEQK